MTDRSWAPGDRFTCLSTMMNLMFGTVTRVDGNLVYGVLDKDPEHEVFFHAKSPYVMKGAITVMEEKK